MRKPIRETRANQAVINSNAALRFLYSFFFFFTLGHALPAVGVVEMARLGHHCRRSCRLRPHCRRDIPMTTIREMIAAVASGGCESASGFGAGGAWSRVVGVARWSRGVWHQGLLVGSAGFGQCLSYLGGEERMVSQMILRVGGSLCSRLTSGPRIPRALLFHST